MATRRWTISGEYRLPKGKIYDIDLAAFYVDGDLFVYNVPVIDGKLMISVKPELTHSLPHELHFGVPSFKDGEVGFLSRTFIWGIGQNHWQSGTIFYGGYPYGMGLNPVRVEMNIGLPLTRDIIYNVNLTLEVEI